MIQTPASTSLLPPRDSLELASLASSNNDHNARDSRDEEEEEASSSSGVPSSRKLSSDSLPNGSGSRGFGHSRRSYSVSSA